MTILFRISFFYFSSTSLSLSSTTTTFTFLSYLYTYYVRVTRITPCISYRSLSWSRVKGIRTRDRCPFTRCRFYTYTHTHTHTCTPRYNKDKNNNNTISTIPSVAATYYSARQQHNRPFTPGPLPLPWLLYRAILCAVSI